MKKFLNLMMALLVISVAITTADACSRVTYTTDSGTVVTGRTMDWLSVDNPHLHIFKRGAKYTSTTKSNPAQWTSKYGVVAVTSMGNLVNSGVNEKGLAADVLWLDVSDYGKLVSGQKSVTVPEYLKYMLDNFATVDEVVKFVNSNKIKPVLNETETFTGVAPKLHYIFTDKTGDNVIIEFVKGNTKVYRQKGRIVMTNDPEYDKMLAIKNYFDEVGILENMPGSSLSQARFVYLSGWLKGFTNKNLDGYLPEIQDQSFDRQTILSVLSLMRGVSTPLGVELSEAEPNNTSTLWRTVTDVKNGKFYFDSALKMMTFSVDLNKIDFSKDYQAIDLAKTYELNGDITDNLK